MLTDVQRVLVNCELDTLMTKQEWVSSHEAVARLRAAGGDDPSALVSWAAVGDLRARYSRLTFNGREDEFQEAPSIPEAFWAQFRQDTGAKSDWTAGVFSARITHRTSGPAEQANLVCSGVEFNSSDLTNCLKGLILRKETSEKNLRNAGARPDQYRWALFAAGMATLAARGQLDPEASGNKIYEMVTTFLSEQGHEEWISINQVRPVLKYFQEWQSSADMVGGN